MSAPQERDRQVFERNINLLTRICAARSDGEISEAHSPTHLITTARMTELVGILFSFTPSEFSLAYIAGASHDSKRSPSEDPTLKDEEISTRNAVLLMEGISNRGIFITTPQEREAVGFSVRNHGNVPTIFLDDEARDQIPSDLNSRIHAALFVADKIEANGARVIARRSSFVAGDRLHNPEGDWQKFGYQPDRDEALVVAVESMLRLGIINPQHIYPEKVRDVVDPLYEVQREFVRGVFGAKELRIPDVAKLLLDRKREDGKNMLEARKLQAPKDPEELAAFLSERTGVSDESITAASEDVVDSAVETVLYFSRDYRFDLDELMRAWIPRGQAADRWAFDMQEYANGNWYNQAREQMAHAIQQK